MAEIRESKDDRRAAARAKAAEDRARSVKRAKRNRLVAQFSIGVVVVAILAIVALVVVNTTQHAANAYPKNMASDGIVITKGLQAVPTPAQQNGKVVATKKKSNVVQIQTYIDYRCPFCNEFEATNSAYLAQQINAGKVEVEIHPIAILTNGSDYSLRSGNAAACVANYDPNDYWKFSLSLYKNQPDETDTAGLSNGTLVSLAAAAGASSDDVASCIRGGQYIDWIQGATTRSKVTGTPTIYIDGKQWSGAPTDATAFESAVAAAEAKKVS